MDYNDSLFDPQIRFQNNRGRLLLSFDTGSSIDLNRRCTLVQVPEEFETLYLDLHDFNDVTSEQDGRLILKGSIHLVINGKSTACLANPHLLLPQPQSARRLKIFRGSEPLQTISAPADFKAYMQARLAQALDRVLFGVEVDTLASRNNVSVDTPVKTRARWANILLTTGVIVFGMAVAVMLLSYGIEKISPQKYSSRLAAPHAMVQPNALKKDTVKAQPKIRADQVDEQLLASQKAPGKSVGDSNTGLQYDPVQERLDLIKEVFNKAGLDADLAKGDTGCVAPMKH